MQHTTASRYGGSRPPTPSVTSRSALAALAFGPGLPGRLRQSPRRCHRLRLLGDQVPRREPGPIPVQLLAQARLAARCGVSLDTVLRRYCAGNTLFGDVLVEEAERVEVPRSDLRRLLRAQAACFDRLLDTVSEEYEREARSWVSGSKARRAEFVERLLAGELLDASSLGYEFEAWHLGVVAARPDALGVVCGLAATLDRACCSLIAEKTPRGDGSAAVASTTLMSSNRCASTGCLPRARSHFGEPSHGLAGWRLTHRQAAAALPIAMWSSKGFVRYSEVALLASVLHDDLLASSLHQLYLAPMQEDRDGGISALQTLRAYFAAERNVSSAAAALGVNRNTVTARLRAIEERIGCRLSSCAADVEAALRLDELGP